METLNRQAMRVVKLFGNGEGSCHAGGFDFTTLLVIEGQEGLIGLSVLPFGALVTTQEERIFVFAPIEFGCVGC